MVVNVDAVQVIAKDTGALKDSSAVVVNGYFKKTSELNAVLVDVDKMVLEGCEKFKKVKLSFKSGAVKMAYLNLMFHGSPMRAKKLTTDKYGKVKMSVTLPSEAVVGMEKLGQHVFNQLKAQGAKLAGEARTLVYSDKNDESHWVYVELDEKDKYLGPVLNGQAFDVEAFNLLTLGVSTADVALGVQVYLWDKENGEGHDYSLKLKIVNINTVQQ